MPALLPRGAWRLRLVAAFLPAALLLSEAGYRLHRYGSLRIPPEHFAYDVRCAYTYNPARPGYEGGFRGGPPGAPPDGAKRILCLGESITAGDLIADATQTWPAYLEARLREGGETVSVRNAAVGGFGTRHILALARARLKEWSPDRLLLLAGTHGNGLVDGALWSPFPVAAETDGWAARSDKLLYRVSALYRAQARPRMPGLLARWVGERNARGDCFHGADFSGVAGDMGAILDAAGEAGVPVTVILPPVWEEKAVRMMGAAFQDSLRMTLDAIRDMAVARSASFLDMRGAFRDSAYLSTGYFLDYHHLTARGNAYFARCLAESLQVRR